MLNTLQISSFFLLFPFFVALWQTATNGSNRFLHATTGALFVSSVINHSRPHDGPVYDDIDNVDKVVVAVNVLAACVDALRDDVSKQTVLSCSVLASVVGIAYSAAFCGKNDFRLRPHVELLHAVCVHGFAAVILTALSV